MKVAFKLSFSEDLKQIDDVEIRNELSKVIRSFDDATTVLDIPRTAEIGALENAYKLRIADYRLAMTETDGKVTFVRILHYRDITPYFLASSP